MFGHPVIYRDAKRGRPAHERTAENAKRVSMLFALGRSVAEVAAALGITQPTLRKHYFSEVQQRQAQLDKLEADQMVKLFEQSESGSTSATKALLDKCEDARRARMAGDLVKDRKAQAKPAPKGVKAQRAAEAQGVGGVFRPRQAPEQLIN